MFNINNKCFVLFMCFGFKNLYFPNNSSCWLRTFGCNVYREEVIKIIIVFMGNSV